MELAEVEVDDVVDVVVVVGSIIGGFAAGTGKKDKIANAVVSTFVPQIGFKSVP